MGINERVKGFLDSWPILKERLGEIEDEGLFHSDGIGRSLRGESKDDIPSPLGQGNSGF
jgi:hypothetical protein